MKKALKILLLIITVLSAIIYAYFIYPVWGFTFYENHNLKVPLTPAWALECWLWEDDVNTAEYVNELLEGYKKYDIPVRTILIDSPWSLRYNDFEIDTNRYPNPQKWFKKLEDDGYRTVLWMTPVVNSYSKDTQIQDSRDWFNSANEKGYLIKNKNENNWWKGNGKFIDYTNDEAVKWWRSLQQNIFDFGIDGWKLDGAATLLWSEILGIPMFYNSSSEGTITTRNYMDLYYRQEYKYGLEMNPEFVTLSRSVDGFYTHPEGFSPLDASPVNWVGDQKHTWKSDSENEDNQDLVLDGIKGIETAIQYILKSAELGYNIIGSDIAGFSGRIIPPRLYIRWTQFSTFCGLFLNGGHGERRLWKRSSEELEIIRKFSWLHTELIPYMYHYVVSANREGKTLQKPLNIGKYQYMFGDNLLVAPIYEDSKIREVVLPEGKWRYFFNDSDLLEGDQKIIKEFPLDEYTVFIKEGAIIPMNIERNYTNIGDSTFGDYLTILIYPQESNNFTYHNPENYKDSTEISYSKNSDEIKINFKGKSLTHILKIYSLQKPNEILLDNNKLNENIDWNYKSEVNKIIIRTSNYEQGNYHITFN
ncbi:MAG: glycoside hydrolase family 31 protein [Ignavibacteriales bacterium]|nr:glycoside hydrolase family 31 protein [Ignavibacteriales bacterium]MCB9260636.1 glycoside hydrolase family 31 protein [Ignavibacteriales bacterium]